jgi:uncharacterized protein DUF5985
MMPFLFGALSMACAVTALLFLTFWKSTSDRFFLLFSLAFWLFALNWLLQAAYQPSTEHQHLAYLVRLPTFLLILIAIVDRNRRSAR